MDSDEPQSLRALLSAADAKRRAVEASTEPSTSPATVALINAALDLYARTSEAMSSASLFSPNEGVEDVATTSLPFLLVPYEAAELTQRLPSPTPADRLPLLRRARAGYDTFLSLVDGYGLVTGPYARLLDRYRDEPDSFSVTPPGSDMAARRDAKMAAFRAEKELRTKLETLRREPHYLESGGGDEDLVRQAHLAHVAWRVHTTFDAVDSLNRELDILKNIPAEPVRPQQPAEGDARGRSREGEGDLRLDQVPRQSIGNPGPLLSRQGKPLQPFTLLGSNPQGSRADMARAVFRPGHNLPTMSIDEYLEEEKRRGNVLQGGVEPKTVIDEDDMDVVDRETYKAREWDEFKDNNAKGAGNTMNMG